ncbi:MAG: nuclear transport factor 2 family protein [Saprospiraceae bacterium]|nr:nuclear transport factor 2 family protein [Saprospiraceae bacterium]
MKHIKVLLVLTLFISTGIVLCQNQEETSTEDEKMIISAIKTYNKAWDTADVEMAISAYANDIYWVNSVGDVVKSREDLKKYLSFIFQLDFVMQAKRVHQTDEITFLSKDMAIVHSIHVESGSRNFHLRVFQKQENEWNITNHLTSKEHPKN